MEHANDIMLSLSSESVRTVLSLKIPTVPVHCTYGYRTLFDIVWQINIKMDYGTGREAIVFVLYVRT